MKAVQVIPQNPEVQEIPLQPASYDIWDKKYRLKTKSGEPLDADVQGTYIRVARSLAEVEQTPENREEWFGKFLWALQNGAIPAGRITSNAGALELQARHQHHQLHRVRHRARLDGRHPARKVHEAGLTLKAGCGIGYEFSTLRPKGRVRRAVPAPIPPARSLSWISSNAMCFTVSSAGGRRGAQMAHLRHVGTPGRGRLHPRQARGRSAAPVQPVAA
jgi:ribonucleoside-diphosphate reductase alpha chain